MTPNPPKVFISYAHKDKEWLTMLQEHLTPLLRDGRIDYWDDTRIHTGANWREHIEQALASVDIGVLLVSRHFLASDFIVNNELPQLLAKTKVVWIAVSHCLYVESPIAQFQAAHDPEQPLDSLPPTQCDKLLVDICKQILAHVPKPATPPAPIVEAAPERTSLWNVPYQRNTFFTGREEILANLHQALATGKTTGLTQAIAGLGGIGKTQTAVEYAYRHRDEYDAVFWVSAASDSSLTTGFIDIARLM